MDEVYDNLQYCLHCFRRRIMEWSVKRPVASLCIVVAIGVMLLPCVTAAALMPFVIIITCSGLIASKGLTYAIYSIFLQGLILSAIVTVLFLASFAIATSASVLHSYRFFHRTQKLKDAQEKPKTL